MQGVSGVFHTASPFVTSVEDNERVFLPPAIHDTTNIFKVITAHAPNVTHVVITSSFANIMNLNQGTRLGYTYAEADWNPFTYDEAKSAENGAVAYCASKTLAEKPPGISSRSINLISRSRSSARRWCTTLVPAVWRVWTN